MQRIFARKLANGSNNPWFIALCVFMAVVVLLFLLYMYFGVVHPLVTTFVIPGTDDRGIEFYNSKAYLEFENGTLFDEVLQSTNEVKQGNVVDFYHVDHHIRDNPIYGKMFDAFAVDVEFDERKYVDIRTSIQDRYEYCCGMDDFKLYLSDYMPADTGNVVLIACCDELCVVRFILLTDRDPVQFKSAYGSGLLQNTGLNWFATKTEADKTVNSDGSAS